MVNACIRRDPNGSHRIFCKRGKYKWWFELGQHPETDAAFAKALRAGTIHWETEIVDNSTLFAKIL